MGTARSSLRSRNVAIALFLLCLAAQLYLVFAKSFNWDEFLHFSQVYRARAGTLDQPLQVLHARILWWAPDVASNLLDQMKVARLFMWLLNFATLFMIFGIARQFTSAENAAFAAFAYLTAGYVFTQSFSIRADPLATVTLMSALYVLADGKLSKSRAAAVGALVGLAGMFTLKAAFYAPCFAGVAWREYRETSNKREFLVNLIVLAIVALISFVAIYLWHTSSFPAASEPVQRPPSVSLYSRWLTFDLPFAGYIWREIIFAPFFFVAVAAAPFAWKKACLSAAQKIALAGFIAPLAVMLFYRNTFPYFFVFLLAPVAVATAPALGLVRERYGNVFMAVVLAGIPLTFAILEPKDVIARQRALVDYVHREFPRETGYLDYSSMIADYPRILKYLTSGNGIRLYHETGDPIVAREIDRGNVPFIIANQGVILRALQGNPIPETFLPADLAAMSGNYVQQWGVLWREGKQIPAGSAPFEFDLRRPGPFVLDGDAMIIDGRSVARGGKISLNKGRHVVSGARMVRSTLWRGDRLPTPPPKTSVDVVFTNF